jgi:hypothetical protein
VIILRIIIFSFLGVGAIIALVKNTKKWALAWQQYFISGSKKMFFGDAGAWEGTPGRIISTTSVIFLGFMFIVMAYVICFSGLGQ